MAGPNYAYPPQQPRQQHQTHPPLQRNKRVWPWLLLITALLAAAVALLAGCSTDTAAHPVATTSTARTTTASPTTTARRGDITDKDRVFLSQLDAHWTTGIERGQLFEAGEGACSKMRAGQELEVIRILSDGETQPDGSVHANAAGLNEAANFVHAAAVAYCPDQLSGIN